MKKSLLPIRKSIWQYWKEWFQRLIGTYPFHKCEAKKGEINDVT